MSSQARSCPTLWSTPPPQPSLLARRASGPLPWTRLTNTAGLFRSRRFLAGWITLSSRTTKISTTPAAVSSHSTLLSPNNLYWLWQYRTLHTEQIQNPTEHCASSDCRSEGCRLSWTSWQQWRQSQGGCWWPQYPPCQDYPGPTCTPPTRPGRISDNKNTVLPRGYLLSRIQIMKQSMTIDYICKEGRSLF